MRGGVGFPTPHSYIYIMKKCSKCHTTKPLTEFRRNKNTPDGRQVECAVCRRLYKNEYLKSYYNKKPWMMEWRKTFSMLINRTSSIRKYNDNVDVVGYSGRQLNEHLLAINPLWRDSRYSVEHIIPLSKFNSNTPQDIVHNLQNITILTKEQNREKLGNMGRVSDNFWNNIRQYINEQ